MMTRDWERVLLVGTVVLGCSMTVNVPEPV